MQAPHVDDEPGRGGARPAALARYALMWIAVGAVLCALVVAVL